MTKRDEKEVGKGPGVPEDAATAGDGACPDCGDEPGDPGDAILAERARDLPRELPPRRDLWPEIEARILEEEEGRGAARDGASGRMPPRRSPGRHRRGLRPWALGLAAAAGLAGLVAGAGLFGGGDLPWMGPGESTEAQPGVRPEGPGSPVVEGGPSVAEGRFVGGRAVVRSLEGEYGPVIEELRRLADASELAPETREALEESLATIDRAIAEARRALETDPAASQAVRALRRMYDAKVDLLRLVAERPPVT